MRTVTCILVALLLAGCVLPQREDPHGAPIEQQSLGLDGGAALQPIADDWWKAFNDPQLDALMDEALRDSPTLEQALARVRLAQSRTRADIAARQPRFAIDADETWQRFSENYYIPPPFAGDTMWIGQATANMHWDIDFWGRQAALIRQSRSQAVASTLDVASARLALAGAIAQAYVELYRSWELVDIATRTQEQREQLLKLTQQRTAAGLDTQIELKIAQSTVPQARALRLQAEAARDIAVHRLAALVGDGANRYAQIGRPKLTLDATLPLPDQLPIDLLAHRPDVLAARERVDAASAGRAAAHAAFYPNVSLTALVGMQAIGLDELTQSGSRIYGIGPALHLPIFDAKRLRAAYKGATAELDTATASYNGVVLDAVREASDQITLNASLAQQIAEVNATLDSASVAHELAQRRYAAGLTTQIVVLDTESRVLDARRALVSADSNRLLARMNLLLMLGGSFDPAVPLAAAGAGSPTMSTPEPTVTDEPPTSKRKQRLLILGVAVLVLGVAYAAYQFLHGRFYESTDDAYVAADVMQITSEVAGTVSSVLVDDTQHVERGQVLVELDRADAQIALESAQAELARTVRQVRSLHSQSDGLRAQIHERRLLLDAAQADVKRREQAGDGGAVSAEELQHSRDQVAQLQAALSATQESLASVRAQIDDTTLQTHPQVLAAAAKMHEAALNLNRTSIVAPAEGTVARRTVQIGTRIAPGAPLMAVVELSGAWVDANFKEVQLSSMRVGQPVELHADLYGDDITFHGHIAGLGAGSGSAFAVLPAQNASGNWIKIVQRVPVRIALDPKELVDHPLRIGLSMQATIDLHDTSGPLVAKQVRDTPRKLEAVEDRKSAIERQIATIIDSNGGAHSTGRRAP